MAKYTSPANLDLNYIRAHEEGMALLRFEYVNSIQEKSTSNGVPTVEFWAMLESMSDQYESDWESEDVWGKMDGIYNFSKTRRKYNLTWRIPAHDLQSARENLRKISMLTNFLYPKISTTGYQIKNGESFSNLSISDIKAAPLLRLKFGNLIQDVKTGGGLYGFIDGGFNVQMLLQYGTYVEVNSGYIDRMTKQGQATDKGDALSMYPKIIEIQISYRVLHNHQLGFDDSSASGNTNDGGQSDIIFPYGLNRSFVVNKGEFSDNPTQTIENPIRSGEITDSITHDLLNPDSFEPPNKNNPVDNLLKKSGIK